MNATWSWRLAIAGAWLLVAGASARLGAAMTAAREEAGRAWPSGSVGGPVSSPARPADVVLAALADTIVARDPFALAVQLSPATLAPAPGPMPMRPPVPVARPRIVAIVGPPWRALVAVAGAPPREVATGDSVAGHVVRRITAAAVLLRGRDSTITLGLGVTP
ncbi:MAG: hypothetical protein MUE41_09385 [Gemmatimonadaceae bacterium]|jgi:hypothetical protein|nr:hypothetical protein [Gemmatimonadaceae bacterium]